MAPSRAARSIIRLINSTPSTTRLPATIANPHTCSTHFPATQQLRHLILPAVATPRPQSTIRRRSSNLNPTATSSLLHRRPRSDTAAASPQSLQQVEPPDYLDEHERAIFDTLRSTLRPTALEVQDISGGCGSMYAINVTSERFAGLSMIRQHRLVNEILGERIKSWHGLQLRTKAP